MHLQSGISTIDRQGPTARHIWDGKSSGMDLISSFLGVGELKPSLVGGRSVGRDHKKINAK